MQQQQMGGPPGLPMMNPSGDALPSLLSMNVEAPAELSLADLKLPQALEQALAFKSERAKEIGDDYEGSHEPENAEDQDQEVGDDDEDGVDDPTPEITSRNKDVKQKRRKKKRKKSRKLVQNQSENGTQNGSNETSELVQDKENEDVEVEYIQEVLGLKDLDPVYKQFARIFESFRIVDPNDKSFPRDDEIPQFRPRKGPVPEGDDPEEDDDKKLEDSKPKLSKRKLKKLTRLSVAELKQLVNRPDVVEMHDVTARDPKLLVQLKAHRNTVPVPRHWCFKRKYLQGKRGIEKPPFNLPDFIKKTGIMEMRAALAEKDDQKTLKAKMRERARPKLGKIDIDYQKLHDAFFKWQTKPRMTIHGDLYYEGKEFETRLKEKKPGDLSNELRTALGMPVGPSAYKVPPPWLIAMQRYGPPPSYPNLKIPGLNAPIPDGCSFGYHAGGWGKPPVDELGKPLYGDVFGTISNIVEGDVEEEEVDRSMWGELESESEESEEEEEEEEEDEAAENEDSGLVTPAEGLVTPSGITTVPAGLETPDVIELRKKKIESEMEGSDTPALYQVLPEKRVERVGGAIMGSTHIYDVTAGQPGTSVAPRRSTNPATVELALDPSELDMDNDAMAARYEQQLRQQQSQLQKEDLSDMVMEHVSRQKSKRKRAQVQENKPVKKYKEFKF